MASCTAWYYVKPAWHQDPIKWVKSHSRNGSATRLDFVALAKKNSDALLFHLALDQLKREQTDDDGDPFGCAEPNAVFDLLSLGASINEVFMSQVFEPRTRRDYFTGEVYEDSARLKPCVNCRKWLSSQDKSGSYTVDLRSIYRLYESSKKVG